MQWILQRFFCQLLAALLVVPAGLGQTALEARPAAESIALPAVATNGVWQSAGAAPQTELSYRLGSGDEITISALEVKDLQLQRIRIGSDGIIGLPLIGRVQAAGFTVQEFSTQLEDRLKEYVLEPHVAVNVVEFRSQPISILGAVSSPGVHQLQGRKTLVEILSLAGGIRQDAGYQLRVTRRMEYGALPLPGAQPDASGSYSVGEIALDDLIEANNPATNIEIMPHDVISVPTGKMIYAIGSLQRSGGFVLSERQEMSVLELLALAGGLDGSASKRNATILRPKPGSSGREEIPVDLKQVMKNEGADLPLYAGDILFVPESGSKAIMKTAVAAGVGVGTGIAIWRLGRTR